MGLAVCSGLLITPAPRGAFCSEPSWQTARLAASLAYRTGITAQEPASSATLSTSLTRVLVTLSSFFYLSVSLPSLWGEVFCSVIFSSFSHTLCFYWLSCQSGLLWFLEAVVIFVSDGEVRRTLWVFPLEAIHSCLAYISGSDCRRLWQWHTLDVTAVHSLRLSRSTLSSLSLSLAHHRLSGFVRSNILPSSEMWSYWAFMAFILNIASANSSLEHCVW